MKPKAIRELTDDELAQQLRDTRKELFNLRLQQSTGQLENASRIRELRRDVARINTVATERNTQART
jgi:large subunit ribosomal protein L29